MNLPFIIAAGILALLALCGYNQKSYPRTPINNPSIATPAATPEGQ